jgi:predicted nucleotidyltransferase/uncharacterized protein YutE (UPF0331/DUF86 family)
VEPHREHALRDYFASRPDVSFALLFGSASVGRETSESDVDVAVYLTDSSDGRRAAGTGLPDVEEPDRRYPAEHELWRAAERICERSVDLVVLNRVPATIAAAALLTGTELVVHDRALYTTFYLTVTTLAEDERDFTDDFVRIKQRSRSLSEVDRGRLVRIIDFLSDELGDADEFGGIGLERYATDRTFRRSVERWVENLVNASVDAAKIVLASERRPAPHTYRESLEALATVPGLAERLREHDVDISQRLAENTRVRNMLAHEYLDLRYTQVERVVTDAALVYGRLLDALAAWMTYNEE